ncbi:MAG: hypothetical protein CVV64_05940 [Candidatus Wallbacteria bacterium HGW-Wallbacteria-1]|jgi:predicted ATPase with chaperone activity|uniref:AAA family ATPase n=1 Tax=Candidatus Wallbacteria bacterium HGW-Wallbacteria-1 TaxID=2013854 RepID=A0A2N1PSJ3_9BACT|nr:MAG: hypothetical protein CVV64_05940 [Candidatus Wallbacteria bacterium HGW-Wallbacteria-1]
MDFNYMDFIPPVIEDITQFRVSLENIQDLILKILYIRGKKTVKEMAVTMRVNPQIIQKFINILKQDEIVGLVGGSGIGAGYDLQYNLYTKGIDLAKAAYERNGYIGPVPVHYEVYKKVLERFAEASRRYHRTSREMVDKAFSTRIGFKEINDMVGQAVCSRKPIFIYGHAGNGKTDLAMRISTLLPPTIIPFAVEVNDQIVKLFDDTFHSEVKGVEYRGYDQRWTVVHPPMVIIGTELTLEDLEIKFNRKYNCFEAPPQVKANGGVFLIDDLGRQRVPTDAILNRLCIVLENHRDFLVIGGSRSDMLTDEIIMFSTNLKPSDVMDPAFLRRLAYKIFMRNPTEQEFTDIWRVICQQKNLNFHMSNVDYILARFRSEGRNFNSVHPRDLLFIVSDYMAYRCIEDGEITETMLDYAYRLYFVKGLGLDDVYEECNYEGSENVLIQ